MHESSPQSIPIPQEIPESPMLQEFSFSPDVVFDDLEAIIPQYNQFIESQGDKVPEVMLACQREALNAMRSIKNGENRPKSRGELLIELDRREKEEGLSPTAADLIIGILEG